MSINLPITKRRIRNHFTYAWWQYVLLIGLAIFGWNLIYTTTRYRSPEELKVEWYCEEALSLTGQERLSALMEELRPELYPDMEEVSFTPVGYDETYGEMQLFVWASAGQGDLYTLTPEHIKTLASSRALVDLQPFIDDGTLNVEGIDLNRGYVTDEETGQKYLAAIPTDTLTGLSEYEIAPEGKLMALLAGGGNVENAAKLMGWLLDNMRE